MNTSKFQMKASELLAQQFGTRQVRREFKISKGATDVFANLQQYLPRLDIAVGPFNLSPGANEDVQRIYDASRVPLVQHLIDAAMRQNGDWTDHPNPRCSIAIEIEFSGSPKLVMGDFTNASTMGLVGLVISPSHNNEVKRRVDGVSRYVKQLRSLGKLPPGLFKNVVCMSSEEFLAMPFWGCARAEN